MDRDGHILLGMDMNGRILIGLDNFFLSDTYLIENQPTKVMLITINCLRDFVTGTSLILPKTKLLVVCYIKRSIYPFFRNVMTKSWKSWIKEVIRKIMTA